MKCLNCQEKDAVKYSKYSNGKFCSKSCATSYSSKTNKYKIKLIKCCKCQREIEVNVKAGNYTTKCDECKHKTCKYCGQTPCKKKTICKHHQLFPTLIKYFGFREEVIGTVEIFEEWNRIKNILIEEYWDNKLSCREIGEKYISSFDIKNASNFKKILRSLKIPVRKLSDSIKNAVNNGILIPPQCYKFKHGWHTTWNGKKVFYRSSYELDYCKELDEKKINYEMESVKILYWDSQQHKERVAIPDFYVKNINTLVEIKSNYTYDEQNMKDKFKAYRKHGYNVKLILEHKEIIDV